MSERGPTQQAWQEFADACAAFWRAVLDRIAALLPPRERKP